MGIHSSLEGLEWDFGVAQAAEPASQATPGSQTSSVSPGSDLAATSSAAGGVLNSADASEVRLDKVAGIRAQLAARTYNIPASAVASRLVHAMLDGGVLERTPEPHSGEGLPCTRPSREWSLPNCERW